MLHPVGLAAQHYYTKIQPGDILLIRYALVARHHCVELVLGHREKFSVKPAFPAHETRRPNLMTFNEVAKILRD